MKNYDMFWESIDCYDYKKIRKNKDSSLLEPVIKYLASRSDNEIFEFHEQMNELLYSLDTKENAMQFVFFHDYMSDDGFLYSRCAALVRGEEYYERVLNGLVMEVWADRNYEELLGVPMTAWKLKHPECDLDEYPYYPSVCCETGSNKEAWK